MKKKKKQQLTNESTETIFSLFQPFFNIRIVRMMVLIRFEKYDENFYIFS